MKASAAFQRRHSGGIIVGEPISGSTVRRGVTFDAQGVVRRFAFSGMVGVHRLDLCARRVATKAGLILSVRGEAKVVGC